MRNEAQILEIQNQIDVLTKQKNDMINMSVEDQVNEFLATPVGAELLSKYEMDEIDNWQISIQVDYKKQVLMVVNCSFKKALKIAVGLPTFSNWDNGTIERLEPVIRKK
jgi:hypothetical protein